MKRIIYTVTLIIAVLQLNAQKSPTDYGMDITKPLPVGLPLGAKAPIVEMINLDNQIMTSESLYKKGPLVVIFYRGEWCPVCNKYLSALNDSLPMIEALGAEVVVVSPELAENAKKTQENSHSQFTFVPDPTLQIEKSFDVLFHVTDDYQSKINTYLNKDIKENNGSTKALLPVPATFVIDQSGTIVYKQFDYDYHNRATATEIYNAVKKAKQ